MRKKDDRQQKQTNKCTHQNYTEANQTNINGPINLPSFKPVVIDPSRFGRGFMRKKKRKQEIQTTKSRVLIILIPWHFYFTTDLSFIALYSFPLAAVFILSCTTACRVRLEPGLAGSGTGCFFPSKRGDREREQKSEQQKKRRPTSAATGIDYAGRGHKNKYENHTEKGN